MGQCCSNSHCCEDKENYGYIVQRADGKYFYWDKNIAKTSKIDDSQMIAVKKEYIFLDAKCSNGPIVGPMPGPIIGAYCAQGEMENENVHVFSSLKEAEAFALSNIQKRYAIHTLNIQ